MTRVLSNFKLAGQTKSVLKIYLILLSVYVTLLSFVLYPIFIRLLTGSEMDSFMRSYGGGIVSSVFLLFFLALGVFGMWITKIIMFMMWLSRGYGNLEKMEVLKPTYSSGWAVGAFFVPVLSQILPYKMIKEMIRGYEKKAAAYGLETGEGSTVRLFNVQWLLWCVAKVGIVILYIAYYYYYFRFILIAPEFRRPEDAFLEIGHELSHTGPILMIVFPVCMLCYVISGFMLTGVIERVRHMENTVYENRVVVDQTPLPPQTSPAAQDQRYVPRDQPIINLGGDDHDAV